MARLLSVADYGLLVALYSILYIFGILSESIQIVVMKYTAVQRGDGELKSFLKKFWHRLTKFSFLMFILYAVLAFFLSTILNIPFPLALFHGLLIFLIVFIPTTRGILQGRRKFTALGINMIVESIVKVVCAVLLVYAGWKVYGAIAATLLGMVASFALSMYLIKPILKAKEKQAKVEGIHAYYRPVLIIMFCIFLFYSLDVIIARIVFDAQTAGIYAIASTIGKIIFLGTQPISRALFPLTAESDTSKQKNREILKKALLLLLACIFIALVVLFLYPDLLVRLFTGKDLPDAHAIVLFTGIAASLLSITNLVLLYRVSRSQIKGYWYFISFVVIEAALLFFFSHNLIQFTLAWVTASAIFLWGAIFLTSE